MADGRAIGMPLYFFPWLRDASDEERKDCQLYPFSVYWHNLDEGIDIIAMISGMYMKDMPRPEAAIKNADAVTLLNQPHPPHIRQDQALPGRIGH